MRPGFWVPFLLKFFLADGSIVTWGEPGFGGDSCAVQEQLQSAQHIQSCVHSLFCRSRAYTENQHVTLVPKILNLETLKPKTAKALKPQTPPARQSNKGQLALADTLSLQLWLPFLRLLDNVGTSCSLRV